jgi:hypothetical protein
MKTEKSKCPSSYNAKVTTKRYQKPIVEKQASLVFPDEIWERLNGGKFQQSCSKCHHCR